jgi:dihydrolipoamide dehydrogenase
MPDFDLTVIGSGPGGYVAAIHAARMGASVAVLEQSPEDWGGTCLNRGCIPTKALVQCAEVLHTVRRAREFGVSVAEPTVDWGAMQGRKDWIVTGMRRGVQNLLKANGVEMITARGRLSGGTRVSADGREIDSRSVLLAPGSVVGLPPVPGVELCLTSDTILGLDHVPTSLLVIGGGVVGMEFAGIFSLLGTRVTVIEMLDQVLTPVDPQVAQRFVQLMSARGVEIHLGARVEEIARDGDLLRVGFSGHTLRAQHVLMATGRRPNTADLGLEGAGVATERGAITVDQHLRTNVDGVYAIGDATGISMLAHTATSPW